MGDIAGNGPTTNDGDFKNPGVVGKQTPTFPSISLTPWTEQAPTGGPKGGADLGSSGGGGYQFDPDKIDAVIKSWNDLLTDLQNDRQDGLLMAGVVAPGKEFASGDWEKLANPSGKAFVLQNQKMQAYVAQYIQNLTDAKNKIAANEDDTASTIAGHGTLKVD